MTPVKFDIGPLFETQWTGIPIYTARLAKLLLADPEIEPRFSFNAHLIDTAAVEDALNKMTGLYLRVDYERARAISMPRKAIDVALFPTVKPIFGSAAREASVIHDLSTLITPEFHTRENIRFHRTNIVREISTNEITFVTSQATADDLSYYLDWPPERIAVAHQFVDWPARYESDFKARFADQQVTPYILVLGTIEPRKNLRLILSALDSLFRFSPDLKIVILGKRGWRLDEALDQRVEKYVSSGQLVFTDYVSEFEKYCLIRLCRLMVFPSLFEGFGIPILEAMSLGKPVLASYSSSIAEVAGEAAEYFDPLSLHDFLAAFKRIVARTGPAYDAMVASAEKVAGQFTPERFYAPFRQWLLS
jgi:glycosyltransferase involved in cell wall biosynthesis